MPPAEPKPKKESKPTKSGESGQQGVPAEMKGQAPPNKVELCDLNCSLKHWRRNGLFSSVV